MSSVVPVITKDVLDNKYFFTRKSGEKNKIEN